MIAADPDPTSGPPPARSHLYVPGDRPERLAKAFTRGADCLIVDWEDAVAPDRKATARQVVADWLGHLPGLPPAPVWLRVNSGSTREQDVAAAATLPGLTGLVLAKTNTAQDVIHVDEQLQAAGSALVLAPLIESAPGLQHVAGIAAAPRVHLLHLGEADLSADLGITTDRADTELLFARCQVVLAARVSGLAPPVGPVAVDLADTQRFTESTQAVARLGFFGRACIHPAQVATANAVFTPTADQLSWAQRVTAGAATGGGVWRDGAGNMVDEAVLRRARRITAVQAVLTAR